MEKVLSGLNDNNELIQKYRQAATEEEKARLLSGAMGSPFEAPQQLDEAELGNVSGGRQDRFVRVMAVCSNCGWRSGIGSPNYVYDLGIAHIDNSSNCFTFKLVAV